ncbi:MAG: serine/threonine protein kinase [Deltaproteobacteria bacterium]|nr:serine/threonine protein kinase [Deltaproteobacteria bacterium]
MQDGSIFLGRYIIIRKLGSGAIGTVYLVWDRVLEIEVALKIIPAAQDTVEFKRFQREVLSARKVSSRYVVKNFECGVTDTHLFLVNEYVKGGSLREYLKQKPLSFEVKLEIFKKIIEGLIALHDKNIIHRDIKLSNILYDPEEHIPKIGDLGIAKVGDLMATSQADFIGSATHMAPEIWRGEQVTVKADIYSLGVLAYELFADSLPFSAQDLQSMMRAHLHSKPYKLSELSEDKIPAEFDEIISACLVKTPELRLSAGQILLKLQALDTMTTIASDFAVNQTPKKRENLVFWRKSVTQTSGTLPNAEAGELIHLKKSALQSLIMFIFLLAFSTGLPNLLFFFRSTEFAKLVPGLAVLALILVLWFFGTWLLRKNKTVRLAYAFLVLLFGLPVLKSAFSVEIYSTDSESYLYVTKSLTLAFVEEFFSYFSASTIENLNPSFLLLFCGFLIGGFFVENRITFLACFVILMVIFVVFLNVAALYTNLPVYLTGITSITYMLFALRLSVSFATHRMLN